jgi:hypothetical protein
MRALLASVTLVAFLAIACQGGEEAPSTPTSSPAAVSSPTSAAPSATPELERMPRLIFLRPDIDAYGNLGVIHMSDDLLGSNVVQLTPGDVRASFVGVVQANATTTLYYLAGGELANVFTGEARDLATGETTTLLSTEPPQSEGYQAGRLSPDGRYVAWSHGDGIDLVDLETDARRRILTDNRAGCEGGGLISECYSYGAPAWSPDGRLLLVRKTFWEGGAAVVVDPFQEEPKELRGAVIGGLGAEIAAWSPDSDAWCGHGHYDSPSGLYLSEQPEWQPRNLLPEYETLETGAPWHNVTDCVWLDERRIAFVTVTTRPDEPGSQYGVTVSIYDLETAAVTLLADFGSDSPPVFSPELFLVPGSDMLAFNDRKNGQAGLLSTTDGARSAILEPGDVLVAVTQPIAWPEGIVAAEPEVRPCAPLTGDCEVQVTNVAPDQVNVREGPGKARVVTGQLSEGEIVCLTGSSMFADGFRWWPVRSEAGVEGWVAQGDPQEPDRPWLTATGRKCGE